MEESKEEGNVFSEITADIPKAKMDQVIERFRQLEDEFTEYIEGGCFSEDYLEEAKEGLGVAGSSYYEMVDLGGMRGLRAKKLIPKSTLILESDPIVSLLGTDSTPSYCSWCFKQSKALKQCTSCKFCAYCGQDC